MHAAVRARLARRRRSRAGLTLIETLLAMVILGVALAVLVASAGQALGVVRRARHFETARHLMDIVELENPVPDLEEAAGQTETGGFDAPYDAYAWERTVEPTFDSLDEETGYYVIRTRIRWSERGRDAYEEFATGVYAPSQVESVAPDTAEAAEAEAGGEAAAAGGFRAPAPRRGNDRGGQAEDRRAAFKADRRDGGFQPGVARRTPDAAAGRGRGGGMPDFGQMMRRLVGSRDPGRGGRPQLPAGSGRAGAGRAFTFPGAAGPPPPPGAPTAGNPGRWSGGGAFAPPPPPGR